MGPGRGAGVHVGLCVAFVFLQVVTSTSNVPRSGSRHSQPGKNLHPNARVFGKYGPEPCFFCFDERQRTMLVFSHMEYAKKNPSSRFQLPKGGICVLERMLPLLETLGPADEGSCPAVCPAGAQVSAQLAAQVSWKHCEEEAGAAGRAVGKHHLHIQTSYPRI